jgi:hypothetical protein
MIRSKVSKERVRIKRAYEVPSADEGTRVLIDRLWPCVNRPAPDALIGTEN